MRLVTLITCLAAVVLAGCGGTTVIKEGVAVAMGAKGSYLSIQPMAASGDQRPLREYTRFELGRISDDIAGAVPSEVREALPREFADELARKKLPSLPGGKTLLIKGTVIHYESEDLLGMVTGPTEEIVVRTEFVDKDTNRVLGVANCVGRTTSRVNRGPGKKAEGLAKAFVAWIDDRYPKDQRTED